MVGALVASLCVVVAGCGGGGDRSTVPVAAVREAVAPYLAEVRGELAELAVYEGRAGIYVRPVPRWSHDRYVELLPLAARTARELLARFPALGSVDICADGPWLPHPSDAAFAPATRVELHRDRLGRLPSRLTSPADVLAAGLDAKGLDFYVDAAIIEGSPAYAAALRELSRLRKGGTGGSPSPSPD